MEGEADTAAQSRSRTVGDQLREARERHGSDIASAAKALRIRSAYLSAIETNEYHRLPAPVYALGFVRAYATHVGLDGEEAVRRFKLEAAGYEGQRDLNFPAPLAERSIPGAMILLVAIILAICGYGAWYYLSLGNHARPERVSAVPSDLLPPPPADTAPAVSPPPVAAPPVSSVPAAPPPPPPAASASPPPSPAVAAAPPAPPATPPEATPAPPPAAPNPIAAAPPANPPPPAVTPATPPGVPAVPDAGAAATNYVPRVYGATSGPARVVVRALQDCWVQVSDNDAVLLTRMLRAGDTYRVPNRPDVVMRAGNAAGLEVTVDGRVVSGFSGRVRHLALDPERLLSGTAVVQ